MALVVLTNVAHLACNSVIRPQNAALQSLAVWFIE
jgi:hypothetical protein